MRSCCILSDALNSFADSRSASHDRKIIILDFGYDLDTSLFI